MAKILSKTSFLSVFVSVGKLRAPSIALLTKVLELRSYLGFRAFLVEVEKILIILRKMIIIYLTRQLERIAETYPIRAKFV